jgi:hypothetical protein
LAIDIADLQPRGFGPTNASPIEEDQERAMHQIQGRLDQSGHFLAAEHGGQLLGSLGKGQIIKDQIATLERFPVEEAQG